MIDVSSLEQKIGAGLDSKSARSELLERTLIAKWSSFSTLYYCGIDSQVDDFIQKRKTDIAQFYISNPGISTSIEKKIHSFESSLEQASGKPTDELGLFLGGFCAQIGNWSRIMKYMCNSNPASAANAVFLHVSANSPLDSHGSLLKDLNSVLSSDGKISGSLNSLILCRHALAPVIKQHNFQFTKSGEIYSSPQLSVIELLKNLQTHPNLKTRLAH